MTADGALRNVFFRGPEDKARWLDAAASEDATDPHLRAFAAKKFLYGSHTVPSLAALARAIHHFVRDSIAYVQDFGGREEFADSVRILRREYDDCDGKARLFTALVRALGIPELQARIRPVFKGRDFVHVQSEVRYPGSEHDRAAMQHGWLLAELIIKGVELGEDPLKAGVRDAAGHLVMAGPEAPPREVAVTGERAKPR